MIPAKVSEPADQARPTVRQSVGKRVFFSALLAVIAVGVSFYLVLFVGLILQLGTGSLNPAEAPKLVGGLRTIALPLSLAAGAIVFAMAYRKRR